MDSGGRSNAEGSVATDGSRTRKKTERVKHVRKVGACASTWVVPRKKFRPKRISLGLFVCNMTSKSLLRQE